MSSIRPFIQPKTTTTFRPGPKELRTVRDFITSCFAAFDESENPEPSRVLFRVGNEQGLPVRAWEERIAQSGDLIFRVEALCGAVYHFCPFDKSFLQIGGKDIVNSYTMLRKRFVNCTIH